MTILSFEECCYTLNMVCGSSGWASAGLAKNIKESVNSTTQDISSKVTGCKKILKKVLWQKFTMITDTVQNA